MAEAHEQARQRIDKWLWVARFFKTRSLAAAAVDGGKIKWNAQTVKPSRELKADDRLEIVAGEQRWTVIVRGVSAQRRPATEARLLYAETDESAARRQQQQEIRRLAPMPGADLKGRPTKKAGRLIRGFNE
ncbi:MAG: RNA-binding S4 domain-containing protein [Burkholderiaceae bacterium]|nr:RNA-binding S4 domain-containing protein [Sulfuritalea sp.]MCF8173820.1 RNA-binding S4 domain-containing protein [Burkholderiaceae bacterium]